MKALNALSGSLFFFFLQEAKLFNFAVLKWKCDSGDNEKRSLAGARVCRLGLLGFLFAKGASPRFPRPVALFFFPFGGGGGEGFLPFPSGQAAQPLAAAERAAGGRGEGKRRAPQRRGRKEEKQGW